MAAGTATGTGKWRNTVIVVTVLTCTTTFQAIVTTASKTNGDFEYNTGTVIFLAELIKLIFSVGSLKRELSVNPKGTIQITRDPKTVSLFLVPSFIYLLLNNLYYSMFKYVDPATYLILNNLKIATTGVLFRLFLKRRLSRLKWNSLALLLIGTMTSQVDAQGNNVLSAPLVGYFYGILTAFLSGFAAVYTEYIMKKNDDSFHWQNLQLYAFGVLMNFASLVYQDMWSGASLWLLNPFAGYNGFTVCLLLTKSTSGVLVSWIMKYADSIVKVSQPSERAVDRSIDGISMRSRPALLCAGRDPTFLRVRGPTTATPHERNLT